MSYLSTIKEFPSRQCLICECMEYPKAPIIDCSQVWLCYTCKTVLQKIVKEKKDDAT